MLSTRSLFDVPDGLLTASVEALLLAASVARVAVIGPSPAGSAALIGASAALIAANSWLVEV